MYQKAVFWRVFPRTIPSFFRLTFLSLTTPTTLYYSLTPSLIFYQTDTDTQTDMTDGDRTPFCGKVIAGLTYTATPQAG
jgi:hypothetical protein